jgi:hypothetical protein
VLSPAWTLIACLAADPAALYLPPSETGGGAYLFDPASPALRAAIKNPERRLTDLLDARALADDLVFLRKALGKQYIGYAELLQVPDFDVEALFDEQIARLRTGPLRVTFQDSALGLFRALKAHIDDRHFGLFGAPPDPREEYTEYQAPVEGPDPALAGCTAPQLAPSTLRVAGSLAAGGARGRVLTVSAHPQGDALTLVCGERRYPLRARPPAGHEAGEDGKTAYEWRRAPGASIIRIRRFGGPPADEARLETLAADYPEHRRAPVIVFDLRGNGGGNDGYAYRWLEQAKRGAWDLHSWSVYPAGSFKPWLNWNNMVWNAIQEGRVDDPAAVAEREKVRKDWPRRASDLSVRFVANQVENHARSPYQGRIFVLVDRGCASSGESATLMLREALGAVVVGERTAGFQEYGNQRKLVLPRTHLVLFFATKRNYFTAPAEAVGVPVDVYLPPPLVAAPVEELLPLLKKLPARVASAR